MKVKNSASGSLEIVVDFSVSSSQLPSLSHFQGTILRPLPLIHLPTVVHLVIILFRTLTRVASLSRGRRKTAGVTVRRLPLNCRLRLLTSGQKRKLGKFSGRRRTIAAVGGVRTPTFAPVKNL